jgi:hypothetical protein
MIDSKTQLSSLRFGMRKAVDNVKKESQHAGPMANGAFPSLKNDEIAERRPGLMSRE